jgi:hypothetical protein
MSGFEIDDEFELRGLLDPQIHLATSAGLQYMFTQMFCIMTYDVAGLHFVTVLRMN